MKSKGSGHEYFLSRAVEEPMEATFELGESIKDISFRAKRPITLGFFGLAIFIAFLVTGLYTGSQRLMMVSWAGLYLSSPWHGS